MTFTRQPKTALTARQARLLTKKITAHLTGKQRGPDPEVRRDSFDVDDERAKPWSPIGDGSKAGALGWIDCFLQVARDFDDLERRKGGGRPLGDTGLQVLEILLGRRGRTRIPVDFKTGKLFPAIDTIAAAAGRCRVTIVRALARLKAHGFLKWVRRSQKTERVGEFGPQREQASNAYFFDRCALPKAVRMRLDQLWGRKRAAIGRREGAPPTPPSASSGPLLPTNPDLLATLVRMARLIDNGSSPSSPTIPAQE